MQKVFLAVLLFSGVSAYASTELNTALDNVRRNCGNISDELADMKTMAGINTAVTGIGTVAGGAATAVGVAKASLDAELATSEKLPMLHIADENAFRQDLMTYAESLNTTKDNDVSADEKRSKNLGNWRTGLLATNTVTNIAGTAIAGSNRIKGDLQSQIDSCVASVDNLSRTLGQARISGEASDAEVARAQRIVSECGMWTTVDLSSINKRARGATVSSGIGAGVGLAGTVTSALANSKQVRDDGGRKEKNMNTAANIMAGGATVASATATIFNATQISAIKRAADVADKCEEALK